ncbi:hypothetical protein GMRT_11705 [Giardia muris]|uniref:Uncharacterized protein n=1 Tax=Giardia muris TaxID=5742 RepID=A0A4Z1SM14_GIAMU|nr:hypothetical protein GMRT_11705 [Giardia muris]|eukprot:TNJ26714.1 hypothetical protein GMRT_11705 [Giardia muris]
MTRLFNEQDQALFSVAGNLLLECDDFLARRALSQARPLPPAVLESQRQVEAPQPPQPPPQPMSPRPTSPTQPPKERQLSFAEVRHLSREAIERVDNGSQCSTLLIHIGIQGAPSVTFASVQTDMPIETRGRRVSADGDAFLEARIQILENEVDTLQDSLARKTKKYNDLKERFRLAGEVNREAMADRSAKAEENAILRRTVDELQKYRDEIESELLPVVKAMKEENSTLKGAIELATSSEAKLEVENRRLNDELRDLRNSLYEALRSHPQVILAERGVGTGSDLQYQRAVEVQTFLDLTNSVCKEKESIMDFAMCTEIMVMQEGLQTELSACAQSDTGTQYKARHCMGLVFEFNPLTIARKEQCVQVDVRIPLTGEEVATLKAGGKPDCPNCLDLTRKYEEARGERTKLLDALKQTEKELDEVDDEYEALNAKYKRLKKKAEDDTRRLDEELEEAYGKARRLEEQVKRLQSEVGIADDLRANLSETQARVVDLQKQCDIKEAEMAKILEVYTTLETRYNAIKSVMV